MKWFVLVAKSTLYPTDYPLSPEKNKNLCTVLDIILSGNWKFYRQNTSCKTWLLQVALSNFTGSWVSHTVSFPLIEIRSKNAHWELLQTLPKHKPVDAIMLVNLQPEMKVKINKLLFCWASPPPPEHCLYLVKKQSSTFFLLVGTKSCSAAGTKATKGNWLSREHCQPYQGLTASTYGYIFSFLTFISYSCIP